MTVLTKKNVLVFGGSLLIRLRTLVSESQEITGAFAACVMDVIEAGQLPCDDYDEVKVFILDLYMRIRGKDFVSDLVSALTKKNKSTQATTCRGTLAVKSATASEMKRKARATAVSAEMSTAVLDSDNQIREAEVDFDLSGGEFFDVMEDVLPEDECLSFDDGSAADLLPVLRNDDDDISALPVSRVIDVN